MNEQEREAVEQVYSMTLDDLDTALWAAQEATPHKRNKDAIQAIIDALDSVATESSRFVG